MTTSAMLAALDHLAANLAAAEQTARLIRDSRDVIVVALAQDGVPYADIALAAGMTDRGVSKIAREAGVRRYPRR